MNGAIKFKKDETEVPLPAQTTVDADLKAEADKAVDINKSIESAAKPVEYKKMAKVTPAPTTVDQQHDFVVETRVKLNERSQADGQIELVETISDKSAVCRCVRNPRRPRGGESRTRRWSRARFPA